MYFEKCTHPTHSTLSVPSTTAFVTDPRSLTFTWWRCYSLCLRHEPTELAHSSLFCPCVYFGLYGPFNCISFHEFSDNSPLSHSVLPIWMVLSNICHFMRVPFGPDTIPRGWLGSKHQLTNTFRLALQYVLRTRRQLTGSLNPQVNILCHIETFGWKFKPSSPLRQLPGSRVTEI